LITLAHSYDDEDDGDDGGGGALDIGARRCTDIGPVFARQALSDHACSALLLLLLFKKS
jgi:hypothetical protein